MRALGKATTLALSAGAATLAIGSFLTSPAAASDHPASRPAPALSGCLDHRPNHPNLSSGDAYVTQGMYLHTDPYAACSTAGYAYVGDHVYFHCWVTNQYGNMWIHVRDVTAGSIQGWISAANLNRHPSTGDIGTACPNNGL
jgi:hypothetical protein